MIFVLNLSAQVTGLKFNNITIQDGLSSNSLSDIIKTNDGFIWAATNDGLNKYDGREFKVYKTGKDINDLSSNSINKLLVDSKGKFLICTAKGLNLYNPLKDNFIRYLDDLTIKDIIQYSKGGYLAVTNSNIIRLDTNFLITKKHPILSNTIYKIFEDSKGRVWIVDYENGIFLLNKQEVIEQFNIEHNNSIGNVCNAIIECQNGDILISTYDSGTAIYNDSSRKFIQPLYMKNLSKKIRTTAILEDAEENLWIGTDGAGLIIFNPEKEQQITYNNSKSDNRSISIQVINVIYSDENGGIWLGGYHNGINFINSLTTNFQHKKSFPSFGENNIVSAFLKDKQNNLWLALDGGGLTCKNYKTEKYKTFSIRNSALSSNNVVSLELDKYGFVWVATYNGGLNIIDPINIKIKNYSAYNANSISHDNVWDILKDSKDRMWLGTSNGLDLYNEKNNSFTTLNRKNSALKDDNVRSIIEEDSNNLFIGTVNGLYRYNISNNTFIKLLVDSNNRLHNKQMVIASMLYTEDELWLSTSGEGLILFEPEINNFSNWKTTEGLSNNFVCGVIDDTKNKLWITTKNGISKFNRTTKYFENYFYDDGLQGDQFSVGAVYKWNNDSFLIGGNNGYNLFNPNNLKQNKYPTTIEFTDFKVFNESTYCVENKGDTPKHISQVKIIKLDYNENTISLKYTPLNYLEYKKNKTSYFLKGIDKTWSPPSSHHQVTYANLAPGEYQFKVKTVNSINQDKEAIRTIIIQIKSPFWETWWFRLLGGFVLIVIPLGFLTITKRNLKLKNESLEIRHKLLRTQMNPHFIFNTLSSVQAAILEGDKLKASSLISKFGKLIRDVLENSRETFIPLDQELGVIENYMEVQQVRLNNCFHYEIGTNLLKKKKEILVSPMLLQPFIENAIEHGVKSMKNGYIEIFIEERKDTLLFEINDNGKGFKNDVKSKHKSLAIEITNERLQRLNKNNNYNVKIIPSKEGGTCVKFEIPIFLIK